MSVATCLQARRKKPLWLLSSTQPAGVLMLPSQVFVSRKCLKDQLDGPTGRVSSEGCIVRGSFPVVCDVDDSVEVMEEY